MIFSLWFSTSLEVQVDGRGALAVFVLGHGLVLAAVAVFDVGNVQPGHVVQLLVLLQADFEATVFFHSLCPVEPLRHICFKTTTYLQLKASLDYQKQVLFWNF